MFLHLVGALDAASRCTVVQVSEVSSTSGVQITNGCACVQGSNVCMCVVYQEVRKAILLILGVVSKQLSLNHGRVKDSTTCVYSLSHMRR